MNPDEQRFVDDLGDTLATWRLPRATGRVYGYLLLRSAPSRSEDLRAALGLSTGAVSTAVRELVAWGLARTIPQPGSRRLLVEAVGGFEGLLAASHERTRLFLSALGTAERLTDGAEAAARLRDVTELFTGYLEAGERVLREHAPRPTRSAPQPSRSADSARVV